MGYFKHGHSARSRGVTSTYITWQAMVQRCGDPNANQYPKYGGRGIIVCDRWLNSFEQFLADMGERPKGTSLDRINNDGNYEPSNCRWATAMEQGRNRRTNFIIEANGRRLTLVEWSEVSGLSRYAIRKRIAKGWPASLAVTVPAATRSQRGRLGDAVRRGEFPVGY